MIGELELNALFARHEGHPMDLTGNATTGMVGACVQCGEFVVAGVETELAKEQALRNYFSTIAKAAGLPMRARV